MIKYKSGKNGIKFSGVTSGIPLPRREDKRGRRPLFPLEDLVKNGQSKFFNNVKPTRVHAAVASFNRRKALPNGYRLVVRVTKIDGERVTGVWRVNSK